MDRAARLLMHCIFHRVQSIVLVEHPLQTTRRVTSVGPACKRTARSQLTIESVFKMKLWCPGFHGFLNERKRRDERSPSLRRLTSLIATCSLLYKFFPSRISPKLPAPIRLPTRKLGPTMSIALGPEVLEAVADVDVVVSFDLSLAIRLLFIPVARPGPRPPVRTSLATIDVVDACVAAVPER